MPPLSTYTPFESLLFFQSLATSDSRPTSFGTISTLLRNNQLVRENVDFDASRLTPEALEDLYATLMRDGFNRDSALSVNGRPADVSSPPNPKKRKISSPLPDGLTGGLTHATLVPELVAHLYAKYRDLVTKEIRDDERKYTEIRAELERLQKEDDSAALAAATPVKPVQTAPVEAKDFAPKEETPRQDLQERTGQPLATTVPLAQEQAKPEPPQHIEINVPPTAQEPPKVQPAPPVTQPHPSTQVQTPTPTPQAVAGQVPQPPPTMTHPLPNPPTQPPLAPSTQKAPPTTPGPRVTPAHPSQIAPRANPVPPGSNVPAKPSPLAPVSQRTSAQPTFQQWQLDPSPHSPYPAVSGAAIPQTAQGTAKRPLPPLSTRAPSPGSQAQVPPSQTPVPHTPSAVPSGVHTPVPIGRPRMSQTPSFTFPSFSESRASQPRLSIDTQGSSTPWKKTPRSSIPKSPTSPPRPRPEDVSPISERGRSPVDAMEMSPPPRINLSQRGRSREDKKRRRGQPETKAAAPVKSETLVLPRKTRAASTASSRSRGRSMASRDGSAAPSEDTPRESRAAGRRKGASVTAEEETPKARTKRKRGPSEALESEPPHPADIPKFDTTQYVMATRNFHRTAAPIMNDVATHKLASIFAKPIGERDAPGYHDLIYRPQDLKSIKSAIHQGSKAVATAAESVSTPVGDGESPVPGGTPSSKGGILMLPKSGDFIPPKGIVNSAQLEKELIRMFANAIMFNPIPQRGFGPAFPMSTDRGSRESTQMGDGDEGGIIQDSLEMFEDVQQAVTRWRAAERTADELANKNVLSLRRGSASDFNTDSTDDAKG
ncbi:uncharacterized protein N7515_007694 [Penicillium bovifimosum]|uniref:Bromo domain-containing protein n=1 Tax=Penicillium bovifimosum TaxID=126998 RepID=A0A9W9GM23_9EURO|nr:uncharacterized protein N7515_007694 [Penicillium bovifimosum]KAJ5123869.1 hypothetical protein N7515_007694 [Penicillium bovifimosum]